MAKCKPEGDALRLSGYTARPRATHEGLHFAIKPDPYHVRFYAPNILQSIVIRRQCL